MTNNKTLTILLTQGPYTTEAADMALQTAITARKMGYTVNLFLYLDGTWNSHITQDKNYDNPGLWILRALRKGISITACERCSEARDLPQDRIIEGVKITGFYPFITLLRQSDKVLTFGGS